MFIILTSIRVEIRSAGNSLYILKQKGAHFRSLLPFKPEMLVMNKRINDYTIFLRILFILKICEHFVLAASEFSLEEILPEIK